MTQKDWWNNHWTSWADDCTWKAAWGTSWNWQHAEFGEPPTGCYRWSSECNLGSSTTRSPSIEYAKGKYCEVGRDSVWGQRQGEWESGTDNVFEQYRVWNSANGRGLVSSLHVQRETNAAWSKQPSAKKELMSHDHNDSLAAHREGATLASSNKEQVPDGPMNIEINSEVREKESPFSESHGKSFVVHRNSMVGRGDGPKETDRGWVKKLNMVAAAYSSAGFGSPGVIQPTKARRQRHFAEAASSLWPELGELRFARLSTLACDKESTVERETKSKKYEKAVPVWAETRPLWMSDDKTMATESVDLVCAFWRNGQAKYFGALTRYFDALQACSTKEVRRRELLADLGFHIFEDFLSEAEETVLRLYWSPDSHVYCQGAEEHLSHRRFFHYGPILPKMQTNTTKSTLGVIPAIFGSMPHVVYRHDLQQRIRNACLQLGFSCKDLGFDQMYVNYYSKDAHARIDFHHDHHITMGGVIAGISCGCPCELRLRAQDHGLRRPPICVQLPPRSLYIMSGLSRWHFQHAIPVLHGDRVSLTFRTVDKESAPKSLWAREWETLCDADQQNAHWPLLRPDGCDTVSWVEANERQQKIESRY